jgi:integrase
MYFDVRAAKQLQPDDHLTIDGCPGLRLVATATRRTWTYRYKAADGRMKQVAIGAWPAMPVHDAAAAWQQLRDQRDAGTDPAQTRREERRAARAPAPEATGYTVEQLVQDFLKGHIDKTRKKAGATAVRRALERLLEEEPAFAQRQAATIRRADCFDVLDARKDRPTSTAKLRSNLGSAWEYALDAGRLDEDAPNWWRSVMKGRLKSRGKVVGGAHVGQQRRVLPGRELGELLAWLPNMHELGRDATVLYLWTVARGVEILGMRPEHVTEEKDGYWWTVPKELTKNARFEHAVDLRVPLVGRALKSVKRRLEAVGKSGLLFEDVRGEQYTQHDFSTYIYSLQPYSAKAARRQGEGLVLPVAGWTPHNLRRSSRTLLASMGCPQEIGEAILGHLPTKIVGTYNAYTYDKERRLWLGKLSKQLEALAGSAAS